jgi:hypothetical protein
MAPFGETNPSASQAAMDRDQIIRQRGRLESVSALAKAGRNQTRIQFLKSPFAAFSKVTTDNYPGPKSQQSFIRT